VPLLAEAGERFGFRSEFSPSPAETLRLAVSHYRQPRTLLVRFERDGLDQSGRLLASLRQRPEDASTLLELPGDHLTPASGGLRRQVLGEWADDPKRQRSLEQLALERGASGFALSVVGNLSQACFQCPGKAAPTVLRGELEIITLSGTLSPQGVHLHLSFSDADCRVWGGHLEPGSLVLKGADLLVGWLAAAAVPPQAPVGADGEQRQAPGAAGSERPRLEIAVLPGCPYSARALRMLRTLAIPHRVENVSSDVQRSQVASRSGASSFPQLFLDGEPIGGYDALAELHGRGGLESLRTS